MSLRAVSAYNLEQDSFTAGADGARACVFQLGGKQPDCVILFLTVGHDIAEVLRGVRSVIGDRPVCGSSGAGTITNHGCDEATHSVGLLALCSADVSFKPFLFPNLAAESESIGAAIADLIKSTGVAPDDTQLLILFPDGKSVYADPLYRGLDSQLGYHIDAVGGTSGNDFNMEETYQFLGDYTGAAQVETRAENNHIHEIDGTPALDVLETFIGPDRAKDFGHTLNMFELGISFADQGYHQDVIMRAILGVDERERSIKLAVDIPAGAQIRVTQRDESLVIQRTQERAQELMSAMRAPRNAAYLFFECSGRGAYLFGEPEPDVEALLDVTGRDVPVLGFFTFGELAPVRGVNHFHNYTAILVGLE